MTQREIVKASNKVLSNYFTGNNMATTVAGALGRSFKFRIKNNGEDNYRVVLCPAYFDTLGVEVNDGVATIHQHNVTEINKAGFNVDAIIDDSTTTSIEKDGETGTLVFSSSNAKYSLRAFLNYIKTNPMLVKKMTIVSNGNDPAEAFCSDMEVMNVEPFNGQATACVDINEFFSPNQYQPNRIIIDFAENKLELSDVLLWIMNVKGGADLEISLKLEPSI